MKIQIALVLLLFLSIVVVIGVLFRYCRPSRHLCMQRIELNQILFEYIELLFVLHYAEALKSIFKFLVLIVDLSWPQTDRYMTHTRPYTKPDTNLVTLLTWSTVQYFLHWPLNSTWLAGSRSLDEYLLDNYIIAILNPIAFQWNFNGCAAAGGIAMGASISSCWQGYSKIQIFQSDCEIYNEVILSILSLYSCFN